MNHLLKILINTLRRQPKPILGNCITELQKAINSLNDLHYTSLILNMEGYTHQEIAEQLQLTVKDVKRNIHQANGFLKSYLLADYDFSLLNKNRERVA